MKKILLHVLIVLSAFISHAQENSNDRINLIQINNQFIRNWLNVDSANHSKILHKDFIILNSAGKILTRKEYLKAWVTTNAYSSKTFRNFTYGIDELRIFGNVALIIGHTKGLVEVDKNWVERTFPYTDTYVKSNGRWLCVQVNLTPLRAEELYYDSEDEGR